MAQEEAQMCKDSMGYPECIAIAILADRGRTQDSRVRPPVGRGVPSDEHHGTEGKP
jgi:hypothetical protein